MGEIVIFRKKNFDLKFFTSQLKVMLKSGLNLNRSLLIISRQRENSEKEIITRILENIESGLTLSESLKEEKEFSELFISVIQAGEESGSLVEVLGSLESYYENSEELKKNIKKLSFYPITVIITVFLAAAFIFKFILPVFVDLFSDFGGELPLITKIFLSLSRVFNNYFIFILIFIIFILAVLKFIYKNNDFKIFKSRLMFKIPFLSTVYRDLILTQIAVYLSLLLKSGLKLISALELLKNIISDYNYQKFIKKTTLNISKGASLTDCFSDREYIPDLFFYLLMTGEETAQMEEMLRKAGDYYYQKLNNEIEKMLQYLEPLLITLTAIFVALLAAAVMMPMFQIYLII